MPAGKKIIFSEKQKEQLDALISNMPDIKENIFGNPNKDKIIWRVSGKWARQKINCTLHGIQNECFGCCGKRQGWTPTRVYPMRLFSDLICEHFVKDKGCEYSIKERPIGCLLYPFELNDKNTLVLYGNAIITSCKKSFKTQDISIFEHFKETWIEIFGEDQYNRVYEDIIINEKDISEFYPSENIQRIYKEECKRAELNIPSINRNLL